MATINITPQVNNELKDILSGISKMKTSDLEVFIKEAAHILARRKTKSLPKRETELMTIINRPLLSKNKQEAYDKLYQKIKDETLTEKEQRQLLKMTEQQETSAVKRLSALVELSQLRNITLDELMERLGINATPNNA